MKRGRRIPPWRQPVRLLWFVLALGLACWLTLHMPRAHPTGTTLVSPPPQSMLSPKLSPELASDLSSEGELSENTAEPSRQTTVKQTPTPSERMTSRMTSRKMLPAEKIFARLQSFGRLFAIVGIAAFLGGILEARRWHLMLVRFMGRLTRMARLPEIVGIAMPTALCSNAAANGMLVSSHADGNIRSSALIAGGMANSYLAYISHSIRVMYPVIGAAGVPAALYFAIQFSGGLFVILGVLCWNRWYVSRHEDPLPRPTFAQDTVIRDTAHRTPAAPETRRTDQPLPWPEALRTSWVRTATLLFRMVCLTVPLMLGIEWLLKSGAFNFWEQYVPEQVTRFFPAELISVVAAQMGGLVQSASVAANLRTEGLIDNAQILLAMLIGSAVGNPFRTLRRNLPSALGIFPPSVALTIVFGMQFSRLVTTLIASALVVAFMHYVLY